MVRKRLLQVKYKDWLWILRKRTFNVVTIRRVEKKRYQVEKKGNAAG